MQALKRADEAREDIVEILNSFQCPVQPDAERIENGFQVALTYIPALENPTVAVVEVTTQNGTVMLDTIDVLARDGFDVYRHTALYSETLRTFLDRKPAPLPEADGSDEDEAEGGVVTDDREDEINPFTGEPVDDEDIPF